jgi:YbbR domain-containing protein
MKRIIPKISRKKLLTFSVFILIATFFWFLNAFSKEYTTNIKYSIEYTGIPETFTSVELLPRELTVTVKSTGFNIFWLGNAANRVVIDINKYAVKDPKDKSKLSIHTSDLRHLLLKDTIKTQIKNIEPKYIVINTQKLSSKKIPVKSKIKVTFKELFMPAEPIKFDPESVTVYAQKDIIDEIQYIYTKERTFKDAEANIEEFIELEHIPNANITPDKVRLIIPVEKYTESIKKIKIDVLNCPEGFKIITFPGEVNLKFKVVLSRFNYVQQSDFKVVIDYNEIKDIKSSKIKVSLKESPDYINDISINPEYVEFLIEKFE